MKKKDTICKYCWALVKDKRYKYKHRCISKSLDCLLRPKPTDRCICFDWKGK